MEREADRGLEQELRAPPDPVGARSPSGYLNYPCPLCGDEKAHLGVNPSTGYYHCLRCGASGRTTYLRQKTGVAWPLDTDAGLYSAEARTTVNDVLRLAFAGFTSPQSIVPAEDLGYDYTQDGGGSSGQASQGWPMSDKSRTVAGIGDLGLYLPHNFYWASKYLIDRNIGSSVYCSWKVVAAVGGESLASPYAGRLVIPAQDLNTGLIRNFTARAVDDRQPRYLFPKRKAACPPSFISPLRIHGGGAVRRTTGLLVEGVFDAMRVDTAITSHLDMANQVVFSVALCGKQLIRGVVDELAELLPTKKIMIMLDTDAAAEQALMGHQLSSAGFDVSLLYLKHGTKDPGAASDEEIINAIRDAKPLTSSSLYSIGARK